MKHPENDKWLDEALSGTIGSEGPRTDFEAWKQKHPKAVEMLTSRVQSKAPTVKRPLNIRNLIMKNPITKLAAAIVLIAALIYVASLPGKSAWAQVVKAFNEASDIHIVKIDVIEDGVTIPEQEAWIKNQNLFRAETNDYLTVDDGKRVLTLYKGHKIAHVRDSFTPYWDYTPLVLKVFRDGLSEDDITIVAVPEERTETADVYQIGIRGRWEGMVWVDRSLNLPVRIVGHQAVYRGQVRTFEMTFNYEVIPETMFSTIIPAGYRELPRTNDTLGLDRENVLFGMVTDESGNPVPNAWVFASYAQYSRAMGNGEFALVVPPTDGSNSIGSADFPMLVWAYDDDPHHVAWTLIRHPESMRSEENEQELEQVTERTNDGVELVIVNEDELSSVIPGEPGEIYEDDDGTKVSDIALVMSSASVITGKVTKSTGRPVAGAVVQIETLKMQLGTNKLTVSDFDEDWRSRAFGVTDGQGCYTIAHLPNCWCEVYLRVYATGFTTDGQLVTMDGENTVWDVQLREDEPDVESGSKDKVGR